MQVLSVVEHYAFENIFMNSPSSNHLHETATVGSKRQNSKPIPVTEHGGP
jgi:hypothetical protein